MSEMPTSELLILLFKKCHEEGKVLPQYLQMNEEEFEKMARKMLKDLEEEMGITLD